VFCRVGSFSARKCLRPHSLIQTDGNIGVFCRRTVPRLLQARFCCAGKPECTVRTVAPLIPASQTILRVSSRARRHVSRFVPTIRKSHPALFSATVSLTSRRCKCDHLRSLANKVNAVSESTTCDAPMPKKSNKYFHNRVKSDIPGPKDGWWFPRTRFTPHGMHHRSLYSVSKQVLSLWTPDS
jgi:hypothetical protein